MCIPMYAVFQSLHIPAVLQQHQGIQPINGATQRTAHWQIINTEGLSCMQTMGVLAAFALERANPHTRVFADGSQGFP